MGYMCTQKAARKTRAVSSVVPSTWIWLWLLKANETRCGTATGTEKLPVNETRRRLHCGVYDDGGGGDPCPRASQPNDGDGAGARRAEPPRWFSKDHPTLFALVSFVKRFWTFQQTRTADRY